MRKLTTCTDGFGLPEVILTILAIAIVGFAGLFAYKEHHKNMATPKTKTTATSSTPNPYKGWLTFSDSTLDLKYPSGWEVEYDLSSSATYDLAAQAVITSSSIPTPPGDPGAYSILSMQLSSKDTATSCANSTCRITATVNLNNSWLPNALLAIVNQTSPNGGTFTRYAVVDDKDKVGGTTITPAKVDGGLLSIYGQLSYGNNNSSVQAPVVTNTAAFQDNVTFKAMINLLDSIVFK
jgi:hypothetical protein